MPVLTTAWLYAGTVTDAGVGWGNLPSGATGAPNDTYATTGIYGFSVPIRTGGVQLIVGGVQTGDDNYLDNQTQFVKLVDTDVAFGSATDLWGLSLTAAQVNASNFGFAFKDNQGSTWLLGTNYGATVPAGSWVVGIEVTIQGRQTDNGFSYSSTSIDGMGIRIHYRTDFPISGGGNATGMLLPVFEDVNKIDKEFQVKIYDAGQFLGEWNDVASEPSFKQQINTLGTQMPIKLGRNMDSLDRQPQSILDETGDDFLSEDGDTLYGYASSGAPVGEGSDADVNYDVNVNTFYGGYDFLITQDGEPIVTQDYDLLYVIDGAPEGRSVITGFISKWRTGYGGDESLENTLLTYGWELNQLILETTASSVIDTYSSTYLGGFPLAAPDGVGGTFHTLVQSFTAPSAGSLAKIRLWISRGASTPEENKFGGVGGTTTINVYAGTTGTGTVLGTVSVNTGGWTNTNNGSPELPYDFIFADYIPLTNGASYSFKVTNSQVRFFDYPITVAEGVAYAGGAATLTNNSGSTTADDVAMQLTYGSGVTTVPFNSVDPSVIMQTIVDFAASKGCHIGYTADSIETTGTTVTYSFKTNTIAEAIMKVLELAPSDWYLYIDPSDNILYFKSRNDTPDHVFTLGRDISKFDIERDMESIVNETYFSGGGTPALFVKTVDQPSQDDWRRGLAKISDNRVTNSASATIISEGHIDRNKDPLWKVKLTVAASNYDIETIKVGQVGTFRGFGNFVDQLELQISEVQYDRDTVTLQLGTLKPAIPKRLEDLRRNLDVLEQQNNPTSPT